MVDKGRSAWFYLYVLEGVVHVGIYLSAWALTSVLDLVLTHTRCMLIGLLEQVRCTILTMEVPPLYLSGCGA